MEENKGQDKSKPLKKKGVINSVVGGDMINSTHNYIKDMSSTVFSAKKVIKNSKNETYQEAISRLGIDEVDVYKVYKNNVIMFYFSILFAGICFIGCLSSLFISKNIMVALSFFAILLICISNAFRFSFRAYQIKNKKLCDVREWWDNASEWFPKI